jgi:diguanylate cyclase
MTNKIYPESIEESGKYLRMTLQNISKHKLAYNPNSYLLWYEYATGRNEHLVKDIECILEEKQTVTENTIIDLIKNHLADNQILLAEKKAKEFLNILVEMIMQLGSSGDEMNAQGDELETCILELSQAKSLDAITGITKRIIFETKSIVESNKAIKNALDSTVSEVKSLSKELKGIKQAAKTDMLTSLLNRRGFDEEINQTLENIKTNYEPLSIIMLDIDHFKKVNDTYGHLIGDGVLKMLSKLLKDCIKGKDIAARFGGEEFIMALPATSLEGAYSLSEQIRSNLMKLNLRLKNTGKSIGQITISLGIALYKNGESIDTAISRADAALYKAKNTGRNRTVTELDLVEEQ